ncbi:SLATT domain-containing protein [Helicobacter mehlei]|nr:SLATT domain-containing protein [Helicobacter mehlei]
MLENIRKELKRIDEDVSFSAKGHLESAMMWRYAEYALMLLSSVSLCITLTFTFGNLDKIWLSVLSIISGSLTVFLIFLRTQEKHLAHSRCGNQYLALRDKARVFAELGSKNMDIEKQIEYLKRLNFEKSVLNKESLPISWLGYWLAGRQIQRESHIYQVDKE